MSHTDARYRFEDISPGEPINYEDDNKIDDNDNDDNDDDDDDDNEDDEDEDDDDDSDGNGVFFFINIFFKRI